MFRRAYVVDLVRQNAEFLSEQAVFAAPACPLFDQVTASLGHRSPGQAGFLEGFAGFRLQNIDELPHPNVLVQDKSLLS